MYYVLSSFSIISFYNSKFLDQVARGEVTESIEKHRFLVQTKIIDENEFYRIRDLPQAKKQEEVCTPAFDLFFH